MFRCVTVIGSVPVLGWAAFRLGTAKGWCSSLPLCRSSCPNPARKTSRKSTRRRERQVKRDAAGEKRAHPVRPLSERSPRSFLSVVRSQALSSTFSQGTIPFRGSTPRFSKGLWSHFGPEWCILFFMITRVARPVCFVSKRIFFLCYPLDGKSWTTGFSLALPLIS
jgi:hypothetical protein